MNDDDVDVSVSWLWTFALVLAVGFVLTAASLLFAFFGA